ncbi:MAG: cupin-like domain-containing protein [Porphyrobacter sp.]|nr:cupin-like domain-containing protein [Porphyrobacter sp.]
MGPVDYARFHEEIRPAGQPVVMRDLAADWPGVVSARQGNRDILEYLLRFGPARPVSGIMAPSEHEGRFFYNADMSGLNFTAHHGSLARFLGELLKLSEEDRPSAIAVQSETLPNLLPGFVEANPMPLLPQVVPRIWIGNRVRVAPHYDLMENIGVCLAGRRRFTVFPPDQLPNLYPGPFELTPAGTPVSMVDPLAPDLDRYPRYAEAWSHAQQATLEPGDALYLPYAWWHGVEALEPVSILVNYWWNEAPEGTGGGYDALLHAMLAYRHLPADERRVWRMMFDHYIFSDSDPAAHLPDHARGIMSPASPRLFKQMRQMLRQIFVG